MKTLSIKALARTEELDPNAMASIGARMGWPMYGVVKLNYPPPVPLTPLWTWVMFWGSTLDASYCGA